MSNSNVGQKDQNSASVNPPARHSVSVSKNAEGGCGEIDRPMLALLQIGQAPQPKMEAEFRDVLGSEWDIRSFGALDHLDRNAIAQRPPENDEDTLFTVLPADDQPILISKRLVINGLHRQVKDLQEISPRVTILCCTGVFPEIDSPGVLKVSEIITASVHSRLSRGGRLGVFVPEKQQVADTIDYWCLEGFETVVIPLSPEAPVEIIDQAAHQMRELAPDAVVYDCMVYTRALNSRVEAICPADSILAVAEAANAARRCPGSSIKQ